MNAAIINIGNELLLGKTLNTNMMFLGSKLAQLGIPVEYAVTIQDSPEAIHQALSDTWDKYDIVISTGGLGPTDDDLSKASIARFFGKELRFDEEVWNHVQALFSRRNKAIPDLNRGQAMVPDGFEALKNDLGTAPGLHFTVANKHFFALQGVPSEMKHIFEEHITGIIAKSFSQIKPIHVRTIHTHGISESGLAELYPVKSLPKNVSVAWLPQTGRVDIRFYGSDRNGVEEAVIQAERVIGNLVWAYDDISPAAVLLKLLEERAYTISLAESCTGGLVQKMLSDIPGASKCFVGGVVTYSNDMKHKVLGVSDETLETFGAVSEACVLAMARGIKDLTNSNVAVSVSGIAGPDGGTTEKPVGFVYFGYQIGNKFWSSQQIFNGDRDSIRYKASEFAILELIRELQGRKN